MGTLQAQEAVDLENSQMAIGPTFAVHSIPGHWRALVRCYWPGSDEVHPGGVCGEQPWEIGRCGALDSTLSHTVVSHSRAQLHLSWLAWAERSAALPPSAASSCILTGLRRGRTATERSCAFWEAHSARAGFKHPSPIGRQQTEPERLRCHANQAQGSRHDEA